MSSSKKEIYGNNVPSHKSGIDEIKPFNAEGVQIEYEYEAMQKELVNNNNNNTPPPTTPKYTPEELEKSKRIFKSATPKYTLDWYVKWVASIFVLCAMAMRGIEGLQMADLSLSLVGVSLWLWVSILWNDRALIILNGVGLLFLLRSFISVVVL